VIYEELKSYIVKDAEKSIADIFEKRFNKKLIGS